MNQKITLQVGQAFDITGEWQASDRRCWAGARWSTRCKSRSATQKASPCRCWSYSRSGRVDDSRSTQPYTRFGDCRAVDAESACRRRDLRAVHRAGAIGAVGFWRSPALSAGEQCSSTGRMPVLLFRLVGRAHHPPNRRACVGVLLAKGVLQIAQVGEMHNLGVVHK